MSSLKARLLAVIPVLAGRRVLVIGDLLTDRYLLTEPARLSREAPVMITRFRSEELIPGGAANSVHNLLALGADVVPVGIVGRDASGQALIERFETAGIDTMGIVVDPDYRTISKTRVMAGEPHRMKQQVLRIDREPDGPPSDGSRRRVLEHVRSRLPDVDAVLFSDYGYDVVGGTMLDAVRGAAGNRIVTVDSRYRIGAFRGVSLATPNEAEVEGAVGFPIRTSEDLDRAGAALLERLSASALLITRGNRGMSLFEAGLPRLDIPATGSDQVTDVSGAGDTVISVATLALASGASMTEAAALANIAAGVVVMKLGAATCSPEELVNAVERYA